MAVKQRVNSAYNWYHPEIHPDVVSNSQRKGILGWTDEENIRGQTPTGKAIYMGVENNTHLNPKEHQSAALTLHNRSKRIREALQSRQIPQQETPLVQQELMDVEKQRDSHTEASKVPQPARKPAMVKSDCQINSLERLLKILRGKVTPGS